MTARRFDVDMYGWGAGVQVDVFHSGTKATVAEVRPMPEHSGLFKITWSNGTTVSGVTLHDAFGILMVGELKKGDDGAPQ